LVTLIQSWENMERKRRGGWPARTPKPGERVPMSFRVTPEFKAKLDQAAVESGKSLAQEVEQRLERSFVDAEIWGGHLNLAAHHMLATVVFTLAAEVRGSPEIWLSDPKAFEAVLRIWRVALKAVGIPALKDYPDDAAEKAPR
jgi:hypothetical protein